jgi:hypothetical protein
MTRMKRTVLSLVVAVQATLWAGAAHAADASASDQAAAQGLFEDAKKLTADGKYEEACPKFEESLRLDPAPGTQFNLGDCFEHVGRTASAWALFLNVASIAKSAGMADREKIARDRAAVLEPKLLKLTIVVPSPPAGGEIKRDGVVVGRGQWGSGVAVDPGAHVVSASAPGKKPWEKKVDVASSITVEVPVLADAAATPVPLAEHPEGSTPSDNPGSTQRTLAIVAAGVGVVGLGVGTVFGLKDSSKLSDAESHCVGNSCDATGVALRDDAIAAGNVSTVFFAVGIVGLAGAAVLWFTAPSKSTTAHSAFRASPTVGKGGAGMTLGGSF